MRKSVFLLAAVTLSATAMSVSAADLPTQSPHQASPAPSSEGTFQFTPYLWGAGLKGNVALGPLAPPVGVDASFIDILEHLKMAFMGTFEARQGRQGLVADIIYLSAKASATGPAGFVNGQLEDKTFAGTFLGAYRLVDQSAGWVDVVGGARVWWRRDDLDITGPGGAVSASREKTWADPVIGVRARSNLTPQLFVQFYGDVGGAVSAKLDWQVAATIGYEYSLTKTFFAGYRYLAINYNRDGYLFDVNMSGPILGASFKF